MTNDTTSDRNGPPTMTSPSTILTADGTFVVAVEVPTDNGTHVQIAVQRPGWRHLRCRAVAAWSTDSLSWQVQNLMGETRPNETDLVTIMQNVAADPIFYC